MRFGVNYTPRVNWFHAWLDLDLDAVSDDFATLASLGLDHVRIFPLWPLLQPNRTLIRPSAVADVQAVARVAADHGLEVVVDVLQGHLSSFDFLPSWVTSWHGRNLFTDPQVRSGQRDLTAALADALAGEPNGLGLSVGNEFIQFAADRHPDQNRLTTEQASQWLDELLAVAQRHWPGGLHTHSFDDDLWFDPTHPFTPELATTKGEVTTVHSWIFGQLGALLGVDHPGLATFARYLCELARAWSDDPARGVWLQEVGAPLSHISSAKAAEFVTATLDHLTNGHDLWGVTWWCSHDVARSLADFPELEHTLGLVDEHGHVKDAGRALAEFISDWTPSVHQRPTTALVFEDADLAAARTDTSPRGATARAWLDAALEGEYRQLIRSSRAADMTHLSGRGITRLVHEQSRSTA